MSHWHGGQLVAKTSYLVASMGPTLYLHKVSKICSRKADQLHALLSVAETMCMDNT